MTPEAHVVVFGGSGFVGHSVAEALVARGVKVTCIPAPRLDPVEASSVLNHVRASKAVTDQLCLSLRGATAVVNAAGLPDASSTDEPRLMAANAASAAVIAAATRAEGIRRLVHVSSAVVQGDAAVLDETEHVNPFSPYSRSKAVGEALIREFGPDESVVYRPPSVHSADRRITRAIHKIASTPLSMTVAPGDAHSPQALINNVGDAIAYLAVCSEVPPAIVIHPWEMLTTATLLEVLGHRKPHLIPPAVAHGMLRILRGGARWFPMLEANRRRIELLWLGQGQASSWLTGSGWTPPRGFDGWQDLYTQLSNEDAGK